MRHPDNLVSISLVRRIDGSIAAWSALSVALPVRGEARFHLDHRIYGGGRRLSDPIADLRQILKPEQMILGDVPEAGPSGLQTHMVPPVDIALPFVPATRRRNCIVMVVTDAVLSVTAAAVSLPLPPANSPIEQRMAHVASRAQLLWLHRVGSSRGGNERRRLTAAWRVLEDARPLPC